MELFLRSGNMPGKKKGTKRVQCQRCREYMTEDQFEKHKSRCRGDDDPPLSGEEDNVSDAEIVEFDSDDDYSAYPQGVEPSPDYRRQQAGAMYEAHGLGLKGRREGEDSKWARIKREKNRKAPGMGMQYLRLVAGSKLARDFRRRPHFMGQNAFDAWQQVHDKKKRYWAEEADVDGDRVNEFVVRFNKTDSRGKVELDEDGNPIRSNRIAAVNGWTTVKSDYKERKQFIDEYPTAKDRKGKSFTKFIHSKYYTDNDKDEFGYPNHAYIERRKETMYRDGHKHKLHMPLPTARQDFMKFVWKAQKEAVRIYLERHPDIKPEELKKEMGFVMQKGSEYYQNWILNTLFEELRETEYYNELLEKYVRKFNNAKPNKDKGVKFDIDNPEHRAKFESKLLKNDSVRKGINSLVKQLLDEEGEYYDGAFDHLLRVFVRKIDDLN